MGTFDGCRPDVSILDDNPGVDTDARLIGATSLHKLNMKRRSFMLTLVKILLYLWVIYLTMITIDPEILQSSRNGIPVTTQRRFDVYPDVSSTAL